MKNDDEFECLWLITHDTGLKHFILEFHSGSGISPMAFMAELEALVERYRENPSEMFDETKTIEEQ